MGLCASHRKTQPGAQLGMFAVSPELSGRLLGQAQHAPIDLLKARAGPVSVLSRMSLVPQRRPKNESKIGPYDKVARIAFQEVAQCGSPNAMTWSMQSRRIDLKSFSKAVLPR